MKILLLLYMLINLTVCIGATDVPFDLLGLGGTRPATQLPQKRLALVIGNSNYQVSNLQLENPVNDARAMTAALRSLGFIVQEVENADLTTMRDAINSFKRHLTGRKGVGLFFFAGHGIQSPSGLNYLIPVDFVPEQDMDLAQHSVDAESIRRSMEESNNPLNILILDACRDNPFETRSVRSIWKTRGLARMQAPQGTLVALSTSPGEVASDGDGTNGLYTSYLIKHIRTPGIDMREIFDRVGRDVANATKNAPKPQTPWYHTSVHRKFALLPANATVPPLISPPAPAKTVTIDFAMFYDNGTNKPVRLQNGNSLRSNDGYFFHIKTSEANQHYIYLFQVDATNQAFKLFPNPQYHTRANPIPSNKRMTIPNEHEVYFLDNTVGQEKFYFLVSRKPVPKLEQFQHGTINDLIDMGFPLRGPVGVRPKTTTVATKQGDTNTTIQEFSFANELALTLTINHR